MDNDFNDGAVCCYKEIQRGSWTVSQYFTFSYVHAITSAKYLLLIYLTYDLADYVDLITVKKHACHLYFLNEFS
jgi:hypothetical protein